MSENYNNTNNENVFFSLDETENEVNIDNSTQLNDLLEELNFEDKINDLKFPFGHGYVVACALTGIDLSVFC